MSNEIYKLKIEDIIERMRKVSSVKEDKELAEILGVKPATISNWKPRGTIPIDIICDFSCKNGICLDWLLLGKGEKNVVRNIEKEKNGAVIYLPAINGSRIEDPDRATMHKRLDMILDYNDDDLKEAIKSNLVSFSKTIEAFQRIENQDKKLEEQGNDLQDALERIRNLEAKGG